MINKLDPVVLITEVALLMEYRNIILEKKDGVATLTLNRPDKLNALSQRLCQEVAHALADVATDDATKVLVLTGNGRGFCSGADQTPSQGPNDELEPEGRNDLMEPFARFGKITTSLYGLGKPTIAAVNGVAVGAGFSYAMACDIRIASEAARFSCIFVRRALVPDSGATFLLPLHVGLSKALELMYTGDMIDAHEAERIRLVSKVVPHDQLMEATYELANRIASGPSVTIELMKRVTRWSSEAILRQQIIQETWAQGIVGQTQDRVEGAAAFREKREPHFQGR
ncbi:MAG: enoyl-CoA hydratase/isomerase family protein [Chloroflexi bacterium]|nr:enoyl-CoA hydratase/isomerase family protein [Chloroflexota bacterium]